MNCPYEKDIYNYIDGNLSSENEKAFHRHLEGCDICSEKMRDIKLLDAVLKEDLQDGVFKSSKDKIMTQIKKGQRTLSVRSHLHSIRIPAYCAAAILIIIFSFYCIKPVINIIHNYNSADSVSTAVRPESVYVRVPDISGNNIDIKKLYPGFIPSEMKPYGDTVLGKYIFMYFDNRAIFRSPGDKSISIDISSKKPDNWKDQYKGKDIRNADGEWLITVEAYNGPKNLKDIVTLSCILNNNIYITISAQNISKEDTLKCLLSIKMTDKEHNTKPNPDFVRELIGPKLVGFDHMTIADCIEVLDDYGIKYTVKGASPDEYNSKKLLDFTMDNNMVYTLYAADN